jgi:hypothetical protein
MVVVGHLGLEKGTDPLSGYRRVPFAEQFLALRPSGVAGNPIRRCTCITVVPLLLGTGVFPPRDLKSSVSDIDRVVRVAIIT